MASRHLRSSNRLSFKIPEGSEGEFRAWECPTCIHSWQYPWSLRGWVFGICPGPRLNGGLFVQFWKRTSHTENVRKGLGANGTSRFAGQSKGHMLGHLWQRQKSLQSESLHCRQAHELARFSKSADLRAKEPKYHLRGESTKPRKEVEEQEFK